MRNEGGNSGGDFIRRTLFKLFSPDLQNQISRTGQKGKLPLHENVDLQIKC